MAQNRATIDCWSFAVCVFEMIAFFPLKKKLMYSLRELVITFFGGERKSCKLMHIECLLLDPSSQGINNLALHFT